MDTPLLPNRMINTPVVGSKVSFTRTLTEADISPFIGVTWDFNPLHTDDVYVGWKTNT